jgi:hypothetical protein
LFIYLFFFLLYNLKISIGLKTPSSVAVLGCFTVASHFSLPSCL